MNICEQILLLSVTTLKVRLSVFATRDGLFPILVHVLISTNVLSVAMDVGREKLA